MISDDSEFMDQLYQLWSKTTDGGWSVVANGDGLGHRIESAGFEGVGHTWVSREVDANFIVVMHEVFPQLMRVFLDAQERAELWEERYDETTKELSDAELEILDLEWEVRQLTDELKSRE